MKKTQPIKNRDDIRRLKQYYLDRHQIRNYTLVTLGINTSLRIGDLLLLKWGDVYDSADGRYRNHLDLFEQKTGKKNTIALNEEALSSLRLLRRAQMPLSDNEYLFKSREGINRPIDRTHAFRIIRDAAKELRLDGIISCHSLRKTFGYHAWKRGVPPAVIMSIYNHSSLEITKRYLSIDQEDRDQVFLELNL